MTGSHYQCHHHQSKLVTHINIDTDIKTDIDIDALVHFTKQVMKKVR